ncbi:hypothetical protein KEM54_000277 [Ascosphaera aggregata]|nr:hypothetical protein KEM54_000277 [Ascosphaera aggregata]
MAESKNMHKHLFRWAGPGKLVIVTGTFDNWTKSTRLERTQDGAFEKELELPAGKTLYKYFIDGQWVLDPDTLQEENQSKILNNVLVLPSPSEGAQSEEEGSNSDPDPNEPITPSQLMGVGASGSSSKKKKNKKKNRKKKKVAAADGVETADTTPSTAATSETIPVSEEPSATISSVAPHSTTAELAAQVPIEKKQAEPQTTNIHSEESEVTAASLQPTAPLREDMGNAVEQIAEATPQEQDLETSRPASIEGANGLENRKPFTFIPLVPEQTASAKANEAIAENVPVVVQKTLKDSGAAPGATANPTAVEAKATAQDELKETVPETAAEGDVPQPALKASVPGDILPERKEDNTVIAEKQEVQKQILDEVPQKPAVGEISSIVEAAHKKAQAPLEASQDAELVAQKQSVQDEVEGTVPKAPVVGEFPPPVVRASMEAGISSGAENAPEAVAAKQDVQEEIRQHVPQEESMGAPAPTDTAATQATAPVPSGVPTSAVASEPSTVRAVVDEEEENVRSSAKETAPAAPLAAGAVAANEEEEHVRSSAKEAEPAAPLEPNVAADIGGGAEEETRPSVKETEQESPGAVPEEEEKARSHAKDAEPAAPLEPGLVAAAEEETQARLSAKDAEPLESDAAAAPAAPKEEKPATEAAPIEPGAAEPARPITDLQNAEAEVQKPTATAAATISSQTSDRSSRGVTATSQRPSTFRAERPRSPPKRKSLWSRLRDKFR